MNSNWYDDETQPEDANFNTVIERPVTKKQDATNTTTTKTTNAPEKTADTRKAEASAQAFYNMFESACRGITRRKELEQLFNATYRSFSPTHNFEPPEFSKVLFAMAHTLKVLRVIQGGTISWNVTTHQDDRRPRGVDHRNEPVTHLNKDYFLRHQYDDHPQLRVYRRDTRDERLY